MNLLKNIKGQSIIEFTFAMVVVMFLIYGMVQIFRWAGLDLANRRVSQDLSLTTGTDPLTQLNSGDDTFLPISSVYHGSVTNGNTAQ